MSTTVKWQGRSSGLWSDGLDWSSFGVPTAGDNVEIAGADVVIAGSPAAAGSVTLTGGATLSLADSLALGTTLSGGTLDLSGTLSGGTLENTALVGDGGTLAGVTVAGTMTGAPIGFIAIDPATAASFGATINVQATLTLEPGVYDGMVFTGGGLESLAGVNGAVTLGPDATVENLAGLNADLVNQGDIGGGLARTAFGIGGSSFTNDGTVALIPTISPESVELPPSVGGPVSWDEAFGPTVDIASTTIDNAGQITLTGGTLVLDGANVVNSGTIALTDGTTDLLTYNSAGLREIVTAPLMTAVTIGAPFSFIDNTGTISADLIDFAGPVALASLGTVRGALRFDNVLDLSGGTLDASAYGSVVIDGEVTNGTLRAGTGTITLDGATLDGVTIAIGGDVAVTAPLVLDGIPAGAGGVALGATTHELILAGGSVVSGTTISAGGTATDTLDLTGGTVTLAPTGALVAAGSSLAVAGQGTLENDGAISVTAGALAADDVIDGSGSIALAAGTTLTEAAVLGGSLAVTLGSNAVLSASGIAGSVDLSVGAGASVNLGTLGGAAVVTVDAGARVTIGALAGTPTISFAGGPALVVLPGTGALPVTLLGLTSGDNIDFAAVSDNPPLDGPAATAGAAEAGGVLDVTGASGDTARVVAQNQASFLNFSATTDDSGGTVVMAAACYRAGTRIATARGAVAIERLRRGDLVRTASGRLRPVVWLGRRRIDCRHHPRPEAVWPVRVVAHAFAPGCPARDLDLSPDHAVAWEGALIPIRYLINGASIAQRPVARVEYWHVELPAHDLLLAEGLAAESYLDTGNRAAFMGRRRRAALGPAAALRIWRQRGCAPLLAAGPRLAAAHAALLARARGLGHRLTAAPALRLLADGRAAQPLGGLRFRLPEGARTIRLCTRSFVPAHLAGHGHDPRRLGVAVSTIRLDGAPLPLDDARLGAGWHAPEPGGWRWTAGDAAILAAGVREVAVALAITGRYWRA